MRKAMVQSANILLMLGGQGSSKLIELLTGIGLGLADIYLDKQLANNADRYEDLVQVERSMNLGKIFMGINMIPYLSGLKGYGSELKVLSDIVGKGKEKISTLPSLFQKTSKKGILITKESLPTIDNHPVLNNKLSIAKDEVVELTNDFNFINVFDKIKVGSPLIKNSRDIYLESKAYDFLVSHGEMIKTTPKIAIKSGVYTDDKLGMVFSTREHQFKVTNFFSDDGALRIKHRDYDKNKKTIELYLDDDTYLLVRNSDNRRINNYIEIAGCRTKRAPDQASGCHSVLMIESLDKMLKERKLSGHSSKISIFNKNLVQYEDPLFPNMYSNPKTGDLYFLHDGYFFHAELLEVGNQHNTTGKPALRILRKTNLLGKDKDIALIVSEIKGDSIQLKTATDLISERVNVDKETAKHYLENKKYKPIGIPGEISSAVDQLLASKKYFIPEMKKVSHPYNEVQPQQIINQLYPKRIVKSDEVIKILKLDEIDDLCPQYLRGIKFKVLNHVSFIKSNMIPKVIKKLKSLDEDCKNYLRAIFKNENDNFINEFASALSKRLVEIENNLKIENISVVSVVKQPIDTLTQDPFTLAQHYHYKPVLEEAELKAGNFAFVPSDDSGRIFINEDKFHLIDPTHPYPSMRVAPALDLTNTLLHEASHIKGITTDISYFPIENNQFFPVLDSIDKMIK